METDRAVDEARDELFAVRRRLQRMIDSRLVKPFTPKEQEDYDRLSEREVNALQILGQHLAPTGGCPDDNTDPESGESP